MDQNERYMTRIIRELIRKGLLTFIGSELGALALGPNGILVGPLITAGVEFFCPRTEAEQITDWSSLSGTELFKLAMTVAFRMAIENIHLIVKLCKDIIRLLTRLFHNHEAIPALEGRNNLNST